MRGRDKHYLFWCWWANKFWKQTIAERPFSFPHHQLKQHNLFTALSLGVLKKNCDQQIPHRGWWAPGKFSFLAVKPVATSWFTHSLFFLTMLPSSCSNFTGTNWIKTHSFLCIILSGICPLNVSLVYICLSSTSF
jgi:hypothetical protein